MRDLSSQTLVEQLEPELESSNSKSSAFWGTSCAFSPNTIMEINNKNFVNQNHTWGSTFWTNSSNSKGLGVKFVSHEKLQNALKCGCDMLCPWKPPLEGSALFVTNRLSRVWKNSLEWKPNMFDILINSFKLSRTHKYLKPSTFLSVLGGERSWNEVVAMSLFSSFLRPQAQRL